MNSLPTRFWAKVDKTETCWLWTASTNGCGYGQIYVEGKKRYAHRLSYVEAHGPISPLMRVDHTCHNTLCVNPAHLQAVSHKHNIENRSGPTKVSRSGVRGVSWHTSRRKWVVSVRHDSRSHYGGLFVSLIDAERAAMDLRSRLMTNNLIDREITHQGAHHG